MTCPFHPPWLDHSNYTWRREQVMRLLVMSKPTYFPITSSASKARGPRQECNRC
jgi:hypothetical protein